MANDFFQDNGNPAQSGPFQSSPIRTLFASVETGFDKMPGLTGNGGKVVAVNAGATALEAIATTGTGSGVRATSPTLVTPELGTPASGTLTNCAGLPAGGLSATATDKLFGRSTAGAGVGEEIACTAAGRALLDDADAAAQRTTLGAAALAGSASQAFAASTLTAATSVSTPSIVTASGALGVTPTAGSNFNVNLSTTGDFAVNTNQLYVDTSMGNVGIGITTPTSKLQLAGTSYSDPSLTAGSAATVSLRSGSGTDLVIGSMQGSPYAAWIQHRHASTNNSFDLALQPSGGNVGIGTTTPGAYRLNVNGDTNVAGSVTATTLKSGGYTVATLPAGTNGERAYVTDATTPTWLTALTGGGAVVCPAFKNASAWVSA